MGLHSFRKHVSTKSVVVSRHEFSCKCRNLVLAAYMLHKLVIVLTEGQGTRSSEAYKCMIGAHTVAYITQPELQHRDSEALPKWLGLWGRGLPFPRQVEASSSITLSYPVICFVTPQLNSSSRCLRLRLRLRLRLLPPLHTEAGLLSSRAFYNVTTLTKCLGVGKYAEWVHGLQSGQPAVPDSLLTYRPVKL